MRLFAALALIAASLIAVPQAQADSCPALHIAITPGTGESTSQDDPSQITGLSKGRNFVREVAELPGVDAWQTPYAATAGMVTGVSESGASEVLPYGASRAQGEQTLRRHLQSFQSACPGSMLALVGFSQGAHITGNIALELDPARLAGVYLISDPMRSPAVGDRTAAGAWLPATNKGVISPDTHGVVGFREPGAFEGRNVVQICADSDPVCSIAADDPVVGLAQQQNAKVDAPAYREHEEDDVVGGAKLLAGEMRSVSSVPAESLVGVLARSPQHTSYTGEQRDFTTIDGVRVDDWMAFALGKLASEITGQANPITLKPATEHQGYWQKIGYPLWKITEKIYGPKSAQSQQVWEAFDL